MRSIIRLSLASHTQNNQRSRIVTIHDEINHAGRRHMATQSTPKLINNSPNASATGGGVGDGDSAAIAVVITSKAAHKWPDDGSRGNFTSAVKDRGQRSPKHTQEDTTINRDAGGRVWDRYEWEYTAISREWRWNYGKKYNNYHELSRPLRKEEGHNNQPNSRRKTITYTNEWKRREGQQQQQHNNQPKWRCC